jgi:hypothetical protein
LLQGLAPGLFAGTDCLCGFLGGHVLLKVVELLLKHADFVKFSLLQHQRLVTEVWCAP